MTKVVFYKSNDIYWGFEEQGHSGFASSGDDILCSAISAMTMLVINAIEVSYDSMVDYTIDEETTNISVKAHSALPSYEKDEKKCYAISGLITTYTVTSHLTFASVSVEYTHTRIRNVGVFDKNESVSAYTVVSVAHRKTQGFGTGYLSIEVFNEDIVVARSLHLGEFYSHRLGSHIIDIDQLGILLIVTACDNIGKRVCRVE